MFKASPFLAGAALLATSLSPLAVSAQVVGHTTTGSTNTHISAGMHMRGPRGTQHGPKNMVFGKVSAISGNTLTVTGQNQTTYTIDLTSAKLSKGFMQNATTITLADIKVGDLVSATGTITGTSVVATVLNDMGTMPVGGQRPTGQKPAGAQHAPMVMGTVSAINGDTLTLTGRNNTTYTVDATNAKLSKGFMKNAATITLADIKVGDMVSATGTITGTNVVATSVNDMGTKPAAGQRPNGGTRTPMYAGTISAVSGDTLTLAARNNTTYTVDATNAEITKGFGKNATTETVAALTTGDHIAASGSLNGTTVTATSIMDLGTTLPTFGGMGHGFHGHKPQTGTNGSK